jgi:hypothetical protein
MKSKTTLTLSGVFVASFILCLFLPDSRGRDVAAVPAILALLGFLLQLQRDTLTHERSLAVLDVQNRFAIGAMSHMANVAFDKHVLFCEEYAAEMFNTLKTLFARGPHRDALDHSRNLAMIRRKWAVWLTPELEARLEPFESAIFKIGNYEMIVTDYPALDRRTEMIDKMYSLFAEVMGEKEWLGKAVGEERAISTIMNKLRGVLGINELTDARTELIRRATVSLQKPV